MESDEWMVTGIDDKKKRRRFILHDRKRDFTSAATRAEDLREAVWGDNSYILSVIYQENRFTGTCQVCLSADGVSYCEHGKSVCADHINHNSEECGA
jgi:hypothetical protein